MLWNPTMRIFSACLLLSVLAKVETVTLSLDNVLVQKLANGSLESVYDGLKRDDNLVKALFTTSSLNHSYAHLNGSTLLSLATFFNHTQLVDTLLENKVLPDINHALSYDGTTPLMISIIHNHINIFRSLLKHDPQLELPSHSDKTALCYSSELGRLKMTKMLIKKGSHIKKSKESRVTPLIESTRHGHVKIVKYLIKEGADVNEFEYTHMESPLLVASLIKNATTLVNVLIENGAWVDQQNKQGDTALMLASRHANKDSVDALMKANANVNLVGKTGMTALMHACSDGNEAIVSKLLSVKGIHVNIESDVGWTALDYAQRRTSFSSENITTLLIQAGAMNGDGLPSSSNLMLQWTSHVIFCILIFIIL